ncbi:LPD7 domain-containing protein [Paracoccus sp. SSK6]|uniref:LPD7 domain-containing protein n=1 Tax=Paracoccus sp. SSK6 TaxID=3143131 RepID=UPI003219B2DD
MIITFSKHTGAEDETGLSAIRYLTATSFPKKLPDGRKISEDRKPVPRILRGNPDLVSRMIASLPFKHRYSSGVLSFAPEDIDLEKFEGRDLALDDALDRLMREFEDTVFAGIPRHQRPPILWTSHSHAGHLELNFLIPRGVYCAPVARQKKRGKTRPGLDAKPGDQALTIKNFNPHPPGKVSIELLDSFRDKWNASSGWADPMDASRRRALRLPDHILKLDRNAERLGKAARGPDPRELLHEIAVGWIGNEEVSDRSELIKTLKNCGYEIAREGFDYISLRSKGPHQPGFPEFKTSTRMKGGLWSREFVSRDYAMELINASQYKDVGARFDDIDLLGVYQQRLERRKQFNRRKYPAVVEPEPEPLSDWLDFLPTKPTLNFPSDLRVVGWVKAHKARISPEDVKVRLWRSLYPVELPSDIAAALRYVHVPNHSVVFDDGTVVRDMGDSIITTKSTELSIRLMALEAKAKGWSACDIAGSEDFIVGMAIACAELGIKPVGTNDQTNALIMATLTDAGYDLTELGRRGPDAKAADTQPESSTPSAMVKAVHTPPEAAQPVMEDATPSDSAEVASGLDADSTASETSTTPHL